ncbi:AcrR family transcriptional regulator [Friedmanniella endophytica]|uniref:AcrR family transcriptional regulator n=1 Tax=Microlunatus kandeliicorticis TaxID=1759536 RepID=A0A7W3P535_9ACTN|nr:TetR/AcrR family transcriptional regulator [Microlunatus kandeliicorticis]MBA8793546.1 AcrR family transcriptional regulator [Microlunatus kandeliicorticis]
MPRAAALPPEERRAAIIAAAEPLLVALGRDVSTRQLAAAAGVAEGTLFRVFRTKEELIHATIASLVDIAPAVAAMQRIDRTAPLSHRLTEVATALRSRIDRITALFGAIGPGPHHAEPHSDFVEKRRRDSAQLVQAIVEVIGPDADRLRVPPAEAARLLSALVFTTRHPVLNPEGTSPDPAHLVDLLLHGIVSLDLEFGDPDLIAPDLALLDPDPDRHRHDPDHRNDPHDRHVHGYSAVGKDA